MTEFNSPNVYYLEERDVKNGLIQGPHNDLGILLVQANWCGYCTKFKPVFQQLANELNDKIDFLTIKMDGDGSEKIFQDQNFMKKLIGDIPGFPHIVKVYKGKVVDVFDKDNRDYNTFKSWVLT